MKFYFSKFDGENLCGLYIGNYCIENNKLGSILYQTWVEKLNIVFGGILVIISVLGK